MGNRLLDYCLNNFAKIGLLSKVCKFIFKGKNNQSQVFIFKNPCL